MLSVDSLNTGDSFVLDCGRTIYAWNGSEANRTEKITVSILLHSRGLMTDKSIGRQCTLHIKFLPLAAKSSDSVATLSANYKFVRSWNES